MNLSSLVLYLPFISVIFFLGFDGFVEEFIFI